MKANKVLTVVFGIALFVAIMGVLGLFVNAIEAFRFTTFFTSSGYGYIPTETYYNLQEPLAIIMLIASIVSICGIAAGFGYLFSKKPLLKRIFLITALVVAVAFVAFIIATACVWFSHYTDYYDYYAKYGKPYYVSSASYPLYSATLSTLVQQFICFLVIAGILFYFSVIPLPVKHSNEINIENADSNN